MRKFFKEYGPSLIAIGAWLFIVVGSYVCGACLSKANNTDEHLHVVTDTTIIERTPVNE